jgi:hypothetical protein
MVIEQRLTMPSALDMLFPSMTVLFQMTMQRKEAPTK